MCPLAHADGHYAPRLIDEIVPGEAAVVDDVVIGFEDAVRIVQPEVWKFGFGVISHSGIPT
jgi:hypothetical protein